MELTYKYSHFQNAYKKILKTILKEKNVGHFTKQLAKQVIGLQLVLENDGSFPVLKNRWQPLKKLEEELKLYLAGEDDIKKYHEKGITWWDYAAKNGVLLKTYPEYFRQWWKLSNKQTRNNVITFWDNEFLLHKHRTSQTPCISQINLQIFNDSFSLIITQRSCDASLGLPADVYQMFLFTKMMEDRWNIRCEKIIFNFNNVHIYLPNIEETKKYLKNWKRTGKKYNFHQF